MSQIYMNILLIDIEIILLDFETPLTDFKIILTHTEIVLMDSEILLSNIDLLWIIIRISLNDIGGYQNTWRRERFSFFSTPSWSSGFIFISSKFSNNFFHLQWDTLHFQAPRKIIQDSHEKLVFASIGEIIYGMAL